MQHVAGKIALDGTPDAIGCIAGGEKLLCAIDAHGGRRTFRPVSSRCEECAEKAIAIGQPLAPELRQTHNRDGKMFFLFPGKRERLEAHMETSRIRFRRDLRLLVCRCFARKNIGAAEENDVLEMLLPFRERQQAVEARRRHRDEWCNDDICIFQREDIFGFLRHEVILIPLRNASKACAFPKDADLPILFCKACRQRLREDVWHIHEQELAPLLLPFRRLLAPCPFLSFRHDPTAPFLRPR